MIKDLLISFKDNVKAKSTNPFFGTLIIVWTVKNWNLFYALFNFDNDLKLKDKISFIINHFTSKPFWPNLGWSILDSFTVLICSYVLINLARLIINFFEKIVTPVVYKITDKSSIVLKTEYDTIIEKNKKLETKLEEERANRIRQQNEYENLEKRYFEVINTKKAPTDLLSEITSSESSTVVKNDKAKKIYELLEKEGLLGQYKTSCSDVLNKISINEDAAIKKFVTLGLFIKDRWTQSGTRYYYLLSPLGSDVHDLVLLN